MANLSKEIFDKCTCSRTPCSMFHPWNSDCISGLGIFLYNMIWGCSKFFLPIYVVKMMLNYKKINKKFIKRQILDYIRTISYGLAFGGLFLSTCCIITKTHLNYFILFEAGLIGGLSLLLESTENKNIDKILFFNQVLETIINTLTSRNIIKRTRFIETLSFMFVSAALMYLLKTRIKRTKAPLLWFYPEKSIHNPVQTLTQPDEACNHKNSCSHYNLEGAYNYFCIGYLLEIVRKFLPKMFNYLKNPLSLFGLLLNKDNVLMGCFFGGFVTIYRYICCHFKRNEEKELPSHTLIAAFIASSTYYLKPNIQILIIALTSMLQLLWEKLTVHFELSKEIPFSQILFCVSAGILIHSRFMTPDECPKYVKNMIDVASNNLSALLYTKFYSDIKATERYLINTNSK